MALNGEVSTKTWFTNELAPQYRLRACLTRLRLNAGDQALAGFLRKPQRPPTQRLRLVHQCSISSPL